MQPIQFYTVTQVANILQFTPGTIYAALASGELRGVKVFGRWRVSAKELERLTGGRESPRRRSLERRADLAMARLGLPRLDVMSQMGQW